MSQSARPSKNLTVAAACVGVVGTMVGMAYAAVPLYDLFCRVTGYGGETQAAAMAAQTILDREMAVRFDASTEKNLGWEFSPQDVSHTIKVGESGLAFYTAKNMTSRPIVGTATYNVTPHKAGVYFNKLECFCFTEQLLAPGEEIMMPVTYFVDPAIADDQALDSVSTITLSYTFFEVEDPRLDVEATLAARAATEAGS